MHSLHLRADPSPGPWTFAEHMYGIAHCLIDPYGCVIWCNLPIRNGPLLDRRQRWCRSSANSLPGYLRNIYAGRAVRVLERIDTRWEREPGEGEE
jgi:hypothetical protein